VSRGFFIGAQKKNPTGNDRKRHNPAPHEGLTPELILETVSINGNTVPVAQQLRQDKLFVNKNNGAGILTVVRIMSSPYFSSYCRHFWPGCCLF
jgi:hypothetical protein